MIRFLFYKK